MVVFTGTSYKPVLIISMRIYEHTNMYVIFRSVDQNLVLPEVLNKIDQFSNICL